MIAVDEMRLTVALKSLLAAVQTARGGLKKCRRERSGLIRYPLHAAIRPLKRVLALCDH
jgi:hypothetical protein